MSLHCVPKSAFVLAVRALRKRGGTERIREGADLCAAEVVIDGEVVAQALFAKLCQPGAGHFRPSETTTTYRLKLPLRLGTRT